MTVPRVAALGRSGGGIPAPFQPGKLLPSGAGVAAPLQPATRTAARRSALALRNIKTSRRLLRVRTPGVGADPHCTLGPRCPTDPPWRPRPRPTNRQRQATFAARELLRADELLLPDRILAEVA